MHRRSIPFHFPQNSSNRVKDNIGKRSLAKMILIFLFCITYRNTYAQKPTIICFGWDYPDVGQISKRIDSMQNTPFDGICFSLQKKSIMEAFDTQVKADSYFEYDKLRSLKWGKYTDNFIILRGYSKTGGNWFDDTAWFAIASNMRSLSKSMFTGKLKGILFDPEYYYQDTFYNPWTYSKTQYPNSTFEEVQDQVRQRGTQFITALQKYAIDFSFLSIWITSLIVEDKIHGPLEGTRHALLLPFVEGILLGKKPKVKIIDGNEFGYWYSKPSQFLGSADYLEKNTVELMRSAKAKQLATSIETSQPIFYDGILARHPSFERGFENPDKWKWLEENLKYAIATSTSNIVWFYYQQLNWWGDQVNDTLINILQNCKQSFIPGTKNMANAPNRLIQPKCDNVNKGTGYYYLNNPKKPMKTGDAAFTYSWDRKKKLLKLKYTNKIPASVSVFVNNALSLSINPSSSEDTIMLKKFTRGRMAILAKYKDNSEAAGLQSYNQ
ncbi:MAG: hypothetical protein ABI760_01610 [Ferruginibacter sp.]